MKEKEQLSGVTSSCGNVLAYVPLKPQHAVNHDIGALSLALRKILH